LSAPRQLWKRNTLQIEEISRGVLLHCCPATGIRSHDGAARIDLATAMVQQFEKTFQELLTAAGTEVQIIETDGF
jgi:hypothetical protein